MCYLVAHTFKKIFHVGFKCGIKRIILPNCLILLGTVACVIVTGAIITAAITATRAVARTDAATATITAASTAARPLARTDAATAGITAGITTAITAAITVTITKAATEAVTGSITKAITVAIVTSGTKLCSPNGFRTSNTIKLFMSPPRFPAQIHVASKASHAIAYCTNYRRSKEEQKNTKH